MPVRKSGIIVFSDSIIPGINYGKPLECFLLKESGSLILIMIY